jgi:hypothetical protein
LWIEDNQKRKSDVLLCQEKKIALEQTQEKMGQNCRQCQHPDPLYPLFCLILRLIYELQESILIFLLD